MTPKTTLGRSPRALVRLSDLSTISEAAKTLQEQFRTGYCYHFALMLKGLFVRGQVVWLAPYEQIGWQDDDGVVYTVGGVYQDDGEPIPVSWLGDAIKDF